MHHVEPVVQILAESPALYLLPEIAVGGSYHPHVDVEGVLSAYPFEGPFLQNPQQLDLDVLTDLADLVQQNGAAVGQFEAPAAARHRARERAPFVAEQFALQQRLGKRRAVHLHELRRPPR